MCVCILFPPGGRCTGPARASAYGRRIGRGRGSCSPHTAASSRGRLDPQAPEPSADWGPTVWTTWGVNIWFKSFFSVCVVLCSIFSYCLGDCSSSLKEEPTVGTRLSSRLMIAWVTSSLQVRPAQPQGHRNDFHSYLWWARSCHRKRDLPCTIRSLRTSCSLCRTCTDTWYWTGSWWGGWHCPNRPSAQEQTNTVQHWSTPQHPLPPTSADWDSTNCQSHHRRFLILNTFTSSGLIASF